MKTKQLVVRSAVTVVATGLTLLSSGTSQASGRGPSGMRMSGSRGGIHSGAIHQGISSRGLSRGHGADHVNGRNTGNERLSRGRDDRGGHGERRHGNDDRAIRALAREREPGDDHGRHRERGDDKGGNANVTRGEREPGDDHGRHREHEAGDDHGGGRKTKITPLPEASEPMRGGDSSRLRVFRASPILPALIRLLRRTTFSARRKIDPDHRVVRFGERPLPAKKARRWRGEPYVGIGDFEE